MSSKAKNGLFVETEPMNSKQREIAGWLNKLRFRKSLFGGVRERDVWKRIGELNDMYNAAVFAERARYDALLAEYRAQAAQAMAEEKGGE